VRGSSRKPTLLRPLPDISKVPIAQRRRFEFNRKRRRLAGQRPILQSRARRHRDQAEAQHGRVWTLKNGGGGWSHPSTPSRGAPDFGAHGVAIAPDSPEIGRKDVVELNPGDEVELFLQFRDCSTTIRCTVTTSCMKITP